MIPRILIIDDDTELCEEMIDILRNEGYFVTGLNNGLQVENIIEENNYDLLITDLKIPGLSGFDIVKNLRKKDIDISIMVISGRPEQTTLLRKKISNNKEEQEKEDIIKLADAFLSKPFNVKLMLDKVRELV